MWSIFGLICNVAGLICELIGSNNGEKDKEKEMDDLKNRLSKLEGQKENNNENAK